MIERTDNPSTGVCPPVAHNAAAVSKGDRRRPVVRRDGKAIVIDIPMTFRRRGKRKEIILPPGMAPETSPRPPGTLALAVARAFRWQEMIESGEAESVSDIARRLRLDPSFVARTIRLTALAPDIIEAIIEGPEPGGLSLGRLRKEIPPHWEDQHRRIGLGQDSRHMAAPLSEATGPLRSRP